MTVSGNVANWTPCLPSSRIFFTTFSTVPTRLYSTGLICTAAALTMVLTVVSCQVDVETFAGAVDPPGSVIDLRLDRSRQDVAEDESRFGVEVRRRRSSRRIVNNLRDQRLAPATRAVACCVQRE